MPNIIGLQYNEIHGRYIKMVYSEESGDTTVMSRDTVRVHNGDPAEITRTQGAEYMSGSRGGGATVECREFGG